MENKKTFQQFKAEHNQKQDELVKEGFWPWLWDSPLYWIVILLTGILLGFVISYAVYRSKRKRIQENADKIK